MIYDKMIYVILNAAKNPLCLTLKNANGELMCVQIFHIFTNTCVQNPSYQTFKHIASLQVPT